VNSFKESVNVINQSNEALSSFMEEKLAKDRTTSDDIRQLKVVVINVDKSLFSISIKLDVHEKLIHQLTTLVHGLTLSIMNDLINFFFIDEQ
jgi:hypothetical protein